MKERIQMSQVTTWQQLNPFFFFFFPSSLIFSPFSFLSLWFRLSSFLSFLLPQNHSKIENHFREEEWECSGEKSRFGRREEREREERKRDWKKCGLFEPVASRHKQGYNNNTKPLIKPERERDRRDREREREREMKREREWRHSLLFIISCYRNSKNKILSSQQICETSEYWKSERTKNEGRTQLEEIVFHSLFPQRKRERNKERERES